MRPRITPQLRHRIHQLVVHAHQHRRTLAQQTSGTHPESDDGHAVKMGAGMWVHYWVDEHVEAGWCHRLKLCTSRTERFSAMRRLLEVLHLFGLRPLHYDYDAVWRAERDYSVHIMQPIYRELIHEP
jgi:hypothetical protein